MALSDFIKLIRPHQWYKNLLIFLPLVFVKELFNPYALSRVFYGFVALCMISGANYVINDIIDREKDRMHPEKKHRPVAAGRISVFSAVIFSVVLLSISLGIAFYLGNFFIYFVFGLFALAQMYSFFLKQEPFLDIVVIGINFILRSISGAFIIYSDKIVRLSPWLILCPFFLALFLAAGKRESNAKLLGKKAALYSSILKFYTPDITYALMIITTTSLLICYALFSFLSEYPLLIYTLPFAVYIMFRYFYLVELGSKIARETHLLFLDKQILAAGVVWAFVLFGIIYLL